MSNFESGAFVEKQVADVIQTFQHFTQTMFATQDHFYRDCVVPVFTNKSLTPATLAQWIDAALMGTDINISEFDETIIKLVPHELPRNSKGKAGLISWLQILMALTLCREALTKAEANVDESLDFLCDAKIWAGVFLGHTSGFHQNKILSEQRRAGADAVNASHKDAQNVVFKWLDANYDEYRRKKARQADMATEIEKFVSREYETILKDITAWKKTQALADERKR